jgi:hypothetical protein
MTTFNEALAAHESAEEAIRHTLKDVYKYAHGNMTESFGPVAQWVLANVAPIHQYKRGQQTDDLEARVKALEKNDGLRKRVQTLEWKEAIADARVEELARRIEALEDAPGPRPNADEVSALRRRIDYLVETLAKMKQLDNPWEDALARVERDVALLKDSIVLTYTPDGYEKAREFRKAFIGTEPQTPEARKMLGLDVKPPFPSEKECFDAENKVGQKAPIVYEYMAKEVRGHTVPPPTDTYVYGPDDYERAKEHIGKLGFFSDGGPYTTEPTSLLRVVESNFPYATDNGHWFAQFKLAASQPVATPEDEFELYWDGSVCYVNGDEAGLVYHLAFSDTWIAQTRQDPRKQPSFCHESEARAWVGAQLSSEKP